MTKFEKVCNQYSIGTVWKVGKQSSIREIKNCFVILYYDQSLQFIYVKDLETGKTHGLSSTTLMMELRARKVK